MAPRVQTILVIQATQGASSRFPMGMERERGEGERILMSSAS